MPAWKAWSILAFFMALTAGLLWMGLAIVVRCDRVGADRVDVTVERRFLGLMTVSRERVADVVKAGVVVTWGRGSAGGRQARGLSVKLALTPRQGQVVVRTRFGPAAGTHPYDAAEQIERFIKERSTTSLTTWWMPWLVNVAALPFVLILGATLGENLLRAIGFFKAESAS